MLRQRGVRQEPAESRRPPIAPSELARVVEYRSAICPVCGTGHGKRNGKNYWDTITFAPNKPFGVIQDVGRGRGFAVIGYFNPDDDPDGHFPAVKARLLQAVAEWVAKGWIAKEEVTALAQQIGGGEENMVKAIFVALWVNFKGVL